MIHLGRHQSSFALLLSVLAGLLLAEPAACAAGHGILFQSYSGGPGGPKEGDIHFKDAQGNWTVVDGISTDSVSFKSDSVTVAVIDSGVLPDHPQLKGLIALQKDFTGEGTQDRIGHGTLVSILLRAPYEEIPVDKRPSYPRVIVAKVANADGTIDKDSVIQAIQWAAQNGAKIVNMSLGFPEGTDDYSGLCYAIKKYKEVLFVVAAGNFAGKVKAYPAACEADNQLSVGALNADGTPAPYSNKGDVYANGSVVLRPFQPQKNDLRRQDRQLFQEK